MRKIWRRILEIFGLRESEKKIVLRRLRELRCSNKLSRDQKIGWISLFILIAFVLIFVKMAFTLPGTSEVGLKHVFAWQSNIILFIFLMVFACALWVVWSVVKMIWRNFLE